MTGGPSMTETVPAERRGFLKALGLATVAAPAAASEGTPRADQVPAGSAQKEAAADRTKARYQAGSAHVQAFYATNRY